MGVLRDERGVVLSWLFKLVLILGVLGVVIFDTGSTVVNAVSLDSSADQVAIDLALEIGTTPPQFLTDQEIFQMAREVVNDPGNAIIDAKILRKGTLIDDSGIVHVRLKREATTLAAHYIPQLDRFTVAVGNGQATTN